MHLFLLPCANHAELSYIRPLSDGKRLAMNHSGCRPDIQGCHRSGKPWISCRACGKTHIRPSSVFPFEKVEGFDQIVFAIPLSLTILTHKTSRQRRSLLSCCCPDGTTCPLGDGRCIQISTQKINFLQILRILQNQEDFSKYLAEITYGWTGR